MAIKFVCITGSVWNDVYAIDTELCKVSLLEFRYDSLGNVTTILSDKFSREQGTYDAHAVSDILATGTKLTQEQWIKYRKMATSFITQMLV